ncbi:MAG: hypothetical protein N2Z21_01380 [Candidatus Sumerlaeaceae bacterium]|nr:hypothetical protein [Candidatus Sumerlaeaceae bacterium]
MIIGLNPPTRTHIHHQRDREKGRPWQDAKGNTYGAIFTFEALEQDQQFSGTIQVMGNSENECLNITAELLEYLGQCQGTDGKLTVLLGRSRRSGYGGDALLELETKLRAQEFPDFWGTGAIKPALEVKKGNVFRILFTSPCIIRDPDTGQIDPAALPKVLESHFRNRAEICSQYSSFTILGGFNRKWHLEHPQVLAVAPGSVVVCHAQTDLSSQDLLDVQHEGLGERLEDGFGRFLILDGLFGELFLSPPESAVSEPSCSPPAVVSVIEENIMKKYVIQAIEKIAYQLAKSASNIPGTSLLGRLRTPLRGRPQDARKMFQIWLKGDERNRLKKPAMEQLEQCKMKSDDTTVTLKEWLVKVLLLDGEECTENEAYKVLRNELSLQRIAGRLWITSRDKLDVVVKKYVDNLVIRLVDSVLANLAVRKKLSR